MFQKHRKRLRAYQVRKTSNDKQSDKLNDKSNDNLCDERRIER